MCCGSAGVAGARADLGLFEPIQSDLISFDLIRVKQATVQITNTRIKIVTECVCMTSRALAREVKRYDAQHAIAPTDTEARRHNKIETTHGACLSIDVNDLNFTLVKSRGWLYSDSIVLRRLDSLKRWRWITGHMLYSHEPIIFAWLATCLSLFCDEMR